jgi:hypothetical protein
VGKVTSIYTILIGKHQRKNHILEGNTKWGMGGGTGFSWHRTGPLAGCMKKVMIVGFLTTKFLDRLFRDSSATC